LSLTYNFYTNAVNLGFNPKPATWFKFGLALCNQFYFPQSNDRFIGDIIGSGGISDLGDVEPGPVVRTFAGNGITIALTPGHDSWLAVPDPGGGAQINAVLLWAQLTVNPFSSKILIAYFDDFGGLPFTADGTDVQLASLPVALMTGENVYRISN
jgi:hypothetical protein